LRFDKKLIAVTAVLAITLVVACSSEETPFATTTPVPPTSEVQVDPPTAAPADTPPAAAGGDAAAGEGIFVSNGCSGCHSTGDNTVVGPGLAGLSSRGDDAYIEESIREPGAVVAEGFFNAMPASFGNMSDTDMADLVAYLKTLN
jgi:cytochrome c2